MLGRVLGANTPGAGGADGTTGNVLGVALGDGATGTLGDTLGVALGDGATVELTEPTDGADLALEPPPK